ncbi:MAG: hypothetical protein U9O24_02315 [Campylobacterota bacterium]|nr:hypothetical protein [Campylobacterota bacterium]
MLNRIKLLFHRVSKNDALKKSMVSLKPVKSIWGIVGVVGFFIVPEIVGFIWGEEIASWAHAEELSEPTAMGRNLYWVLEKLFEEGGSWLNLTIGVALLAWLFQDEKSDDKKRIKQ